MFVIILKNLMEQEHFVDLMMEAMMPHLKALNFDKKTMTKNLLYGLMLQSCLAHFSGWRSRNEKRWTESGL
ncbi:hypothetical protein CsatB_008387 [Cannabis sativa]